jgi:tetratricopeptide (TPR) repeat protein
MPSTTFNTGKTGGVTRANRMARGLLVTAVLLVAALLAYANSFNVPFYMDDLGLIAERRLLQDIDWSVESFVSVWQADSRPIAYITFAVNYLLHGDAVWGYHAVNLGIHVLASLLLYLLFRQTLSLAGPSRDADEVRLVASAAALLWLVHPLHTQSVTYLIQRMNSLAALFFVLALLLYVRGRQARPGPRRYLALSACAVAGALAIGSKQNAATLPLFLVLYDWLFFGGGTAGWLKKNVRTLAVAAALGAVVVAYLLPGSPGGLVDSLHESYRPYEFSMGERVLTELRVVMHYLSLLALPLPGRLHLDYDFALSHSLLDPPTTLLALLLIAAALAAACLAARRRPILAFAVFWFFGNLAIESSVVGLDLVFEHRTYLPSMFLALAAADELARALPARRVWLAVIAGLVSLGIYWTHQRNVIWQDPILFWTQNAQRAPGAVRPYVNLGKALKAQGRIDEAAEWYVKAVAVAPDYFKAHYNLGNTRYEQGRLEEAADAYRRALRINPEYADAHFNLATTMYRMERLQDAARHYRRALETRRHERLAHFNPAHAHLGLANTLAALDRLPEAVRECRRAIEVDPGIPGAYLYLAVLLLRADQPTEAIPALQTALRLDPGLAEGHYLLGQIAFKSGDRTAAARHVERALALRPDHEGALALWQRLGVEGEPPAQ